MKKIVEFWESDYSDYKWKENYDSEEDFEDGWHEEFIDCDMLRFDGDDEKIVWIIEYEDEVLYFIPPDADLDFELVEEILEKFYCNEDPKENGFLSLDDGVPTPLVGAKPIEIKGTNPVLKYRGGKGYSYSFWEYIG